MNLTGNLIGNLTGNLIENLIENFRPQATLTEEEVERGLKMMTWEGVTSMAMFSVTASGLLAAFALALGANNFQIGILAAIPFITQPLQIPAILLVERLRWRKAIALASWIPAQLMWLLVALIPLIVAFPSNTAVAMLLVVLALRGVPGAVANCSFNSWSRDLVPQRVLGGFFSRRLALSTVVAMVFSLAGGLFIEYWQGRASPGNEVFGYTVVLLVGAIFFGLASPSFMARIPEPLMPRSASPRQSLVVMIATPLRDHNFRQLLNFLFFWGFAASLATPFFTVVMLQGLDFPLWAVIGLNTLSQLTFVLFLRIWGPFADRFGSKVILSLSTSLYLLVILGWAFTTMPEKHLLTLPLVVILQVFAGAAASGVNLTVGTIGLKLAPEGESTPYLAVAALASSLGTGFGPLAGGLFSDFFSVRQLGLVFEWVDPSRVAQVTFLNFTGFDFLFVLAFIIGLVTLNTLTTLLEEGEVGREVVLAELLGPTREMARVIGHIPGLRGLSKYPYAYLGRIPGLDVAVGVTAYQIAAAVRSAVAAARRGKVNRMDVADQVVNVVSYAVDQIQDLEQMGASQTLEIARHTARGMVYATQGASEELRNLNVGTVLGTVRALREVVANPEDVLREIGYGTILGAVEVGGDVARSARQVIRGAREAARELGISESQAADWVAQGALKAGEAIGPDVATQVREALSN
ncbi:MAG TPA: MFS transporter [Dehalococcoidia bacterium]|nr:MFS transporter [Dehalococcoidia bacterium]